MHARIAALLLVVCCLSAAYAQVPQPKEITGDWDGTLKGMIELRLRLHVWKTDSGSLAATVTAVDTGGRVEPVSDLVVDGWKVTFRVPYTHFEGGLNEDSSVISGTWTDMATSAVEFRRVTQTKKEPRRAKPSDIDGYWTGTLKVDPLPGCDPATSESQQIFQIINTTDGLVVTWPSPYKGEKDFIASSVTRVGGSLDIEMRQLAASFHGTFNEKKTIINGTWIETGSGKQYPLILTRSRRPPKLEARALQLCVMNGM